jgi:hypothetical protein
VARLDAYNIFDRTYVSTQTVQYKEGSDGGWEGYVGGIGDVGDEDVIFGGSVEEVDCIRSFIIRKPFLELRKVFLLR